MRKLIITLAGICLIGSGAIATNASASGAHTTHAAMKGAELASQAKVSLATARAAALHARPGRVTDQELEREGGGSGLRYSFDILSGGKTYEVGVDAMTGRVLENAAEGKNPD